MSYKHFENLPNNWNLDKFENLAKITCGVAATPEYVDKNIGVPFFSASNVQKGLLDTKKVKYIPRELHERLTKNTKPGFGDVLMTRVGAGIGETAIVDIKYDFSVYVSLTLIKPNKKLNSSYVKYVLNTDYYRYLAIREQFAGGGVQNLNVQMVKNYLIAVPPLVEQQKIAKILSTWDKAIGTTERLIENSTQQKKALMQQLLTGKKRLLDEAGKRFEGEWEEVTVSSFGKVVTGSTPPKNDSSNYDGNISWATAEDFKQKYVSNTKVKLTESGATKARVVPKGSVLVTCIASIGKNAIANEDLATNQQINSVVINKNNSNEFFYYLIEFNTHKLLAWAGTTAVPILNKTSFEKVKFIVPNLKEQQKIATVLTNADKEIELLEQQLADLQQEKKALMQVLLTGKKRVRLND
ncbi:restriction endonuclease subunit S [uncultured Psychrobacter sp.]|uniref:restriction endonuclease subunit S n=1 Tax=uncultured Psychrobacter sp. TaxID=259303 RepID=UPI002598EE08|nr:restriction endonuclease subunit S [uncultured Psychrobacter sp.]